MISLHPLKVRLDSPFQIGQVCLDYSKLIYYQNYYQGLKKVFGDRIKSCYQDTDSVITTIEDPENTFYKDLVKNEHLLDFSKLPPSHPIFQQFSNIPNLRTKNAGKSGIWKIESVDIDELLVLRPKQYSLLYFDNTYTIKSRGVPKATLKSVNHEFLKDVILNNKSESKRSDYIRSYDHRVYQINVDRVSFHTLDVNRVWPDPDNINYSVPYGHYSLRV